MSQFLNMWDALDARRKVVAVLAVIALIVALIGLGRLVNSPNMSLLYSGLDNATSGDIVAALETRKIPFEVRGNAIFVETSQRDQARMSLASEGLPANGNAGYELLDGLSGFGTTSQMFDAAYWRAKEGELARTILATSNVRAARVHISNPVNRPFERNHQQSASVIVTMSSGELATNQAKAIRFLVASAVAGLGPEDVSVIDSSGGIILAAGLEPEKSAVDDAQERAANMRANIERLLAARVGTGKAIVEVHIDAVMDSETITERVLDPEGRVAVSSDTQEVSSSSAGGAGGGVTVASNLPDGAGDAAGGGSSANNSETRETLNFDVSEVRRERVKPPGEIRRLSVAVLVDGITTSDAAGNSNWAPRSDEELASLKQLVQSAIGFDVARGDVVTIESMQFSTPPTDGTLAEAGMFDVIAVNAFSLIQMAILAIVALVIALFVVKPILTAQAAPELDALIGPKGVDELGEPGQVTQIDGATGEIEMAPDVIGAEQQESPHLRQLKSVISDRETESASVLQDWLDTPTTAPAAIPEKA